MPANRHSHIVRITALALAGAVNLLFLSLWLFSRAHVAPEAAVTAMIWIAAPLPTRAPRPAPQRKSRTTAAVRAPLPIVTPPPLTTPDTAITAPIDWYAEGARAARSILEDQVRERPAPSLDSKPQVLALPDKSNMPHKAGDTEHFEGGEVITWINALCYYTNRPGPMTFGGASQKVCKIRSLGERRSEALAAELEQAVRPEYPDPPAPD